MTALEPILASIKHYCAYQERCHSEVCNKLIALNCFGDDLEEAIGILIEEGYLNEERFAIAYAGGKFRMQSWGRIKIKQQLRLKQVSDYCIAKGLANIDADVYMLKLIQLLLKKKESLGKLQDWKLRQKVNQYLLQKGFENDCIQEAWKSIESM